MMEPLSLSFSTCPNDTFMFDAMIHHKIDTEGLSFAFQTHDIEELNHKAFSGCFDITKLSYHAYLYLYPHYIMLPSGSALGNQVGPLLVSGKKIRVEEIPNMKVAIPGKYTTASMLLSFLAPKPKEIKEVLFSDIEEAIIHGEVDAGVIIHESRFTFEQKGLYKMADLGELWTRAFQVPIPLGGIAIKRSLNLDVKKKISRVLQKSIQYAFQNPESSAEFVKSLAKELDPEVIKKHIQLYVNELSIHLGKEGGDAIQRLFELGVKKGLIPEYKTTQLIL